MPACPKCGREMVGGAPHGPWPVQYECHRCGQYVIPPSQPDREPYNRYREEQEDE
jgi:predicted RNA-binding Zn-ribbon protein involved in translation (DUF1610 family)